MSDLAAALRDPVAFVRVWAAGTRPQERIVRLGSIAIPRQSLTQNGLCDCELMVFNPWNYMMATAIVYALPPIAIYYAFRRRMTAGLALGGVKG